MRLLPPFLAIVLIMGCTRTELKMVKPMEGQKALHVVLVNDPMLITLDMKGIFQAHGIKTTFSSEEVRKETIVKQGENTSVIYKAATDSPYRYQMTFSYAVHPVSNLITAMAAQVWDAEKKEIIAKYSVRNLDWYLNTEEASERLYRDFISKLFN